MSGNVVPIRDNALAYVALLLLLGAAVAVPYLGLGLAASLGVASAKGMIILLVFMHIRNAHKLTVMFSLAGLVWLAILLVLSLSDYSTRSLVVMPPEGYEARVDPSAP